MLPELLIDITKLQSNAREVIRMCRRHNIGVALVTKVLSGDTRVVKNIAGLGFSYLADSRLENLEMLPDINIPKMLLRLPMKSDAARVVRVADISLNSEFSVIKALDEAAKDAGVVHNIILMFDLGDLREGVFFRDDYLPLVGAIINLKYIRLYGIGANLSCYGGVIPDKNNLGELVLIKRNIEKQFRLSLELISGGNSSSLYLLENGQMPEEINNLRIGEALYLGRETAFRQRIPALYDDIFTFRAELIEVKEKPSYPLGTVKTDAFGKRPVITDRGLMIRGIIAAGKQDVFPEHLTPLGAYDIIGGSSDHIILELSGHYNTGDILEFRPDYGGLLGLMTSPYVKKTIVS